MRALEHDMQAFLMFFAVLGSAVSVALLLLGPVLSLLALPGQLLLAIVGLALAIPFFGSLLRPPAGGSVPKQS